MLNVIITSYKEPKSTLKAVNSILNQNIKDLKVIVIDPFEEVGEFLKENIKDKRFIFILDPGEGKTYALNMIFQEFFSSNKDDILAFTDGDVFISKGSLKSIIKAFKDKEVGCVTGRPVTVDKPNEKYGYWANLLYDAIHNLRLRLDKEKQFFQSTGYLFAIRNGVIKEIPHDVPEDAVIPYMMWKEGYRNKYVPEAEVYVKYPNNWKDWINQRIRTIKAHENLNKLIPDMPRTKSFFNEIKGGLFYTISKPKTPKEFLWLIELYFARVYIYYRSFKEMRQNQVFDPAWREVEIKSTNTLD